MIGLANRNLPRTIGDGMIHQSHLDAMVEWDFPLPELKKGKTTAEETKMFLSTSSTSTMGYFISDCHGEDSIGYTQTHYTDLEQINRCPNSLMLQCYTKGVIRIHKSKKDGQHNGQKKKNKRTNNETYT
jgi:hypothetical protein